MSRRDDARTGRLISPKRAAVQVLGFLVGLALLAVCIHRAWPRTPEELASWQQLGDASIGLLLLLVGATAVSSVANGTMFWIAIRPVKHVGWRDLQVLNLVANLLNYAPIRLGAISRVVYHVRVDRLSILQIGAWFSVIGYFLLVTVGSLVLATFARQQVDVWWGLIAAGFMSVGTVLPRAVSGLPLVQRHGRGLGEILASARVRWGMIGLRIVDFAAFAVRMGAAAAMLGLQLETDTIVLLALVALTAGLVPFGRVGFREFAVAATAEWLQMDQDTASASLNQLALLDSAGEAALFVPFGALGLFWLRARLTRPPAPAAG